MKMSAEEMAFALDEAVARFAAGGIVVTSQDLQRELMLEAEVNTPEELLEFGWTPDIIVHHVDWDRLSRIRSS